jgi:hypothetical protein
MSDVDAFPDTVPARIAAIFERAVPDGQATGVVAAVARGESVQVVTAGVMAVGGAPMQRDTAWSNAPSQDLTVLVLTWHAADENGIPAVCDDVLQAARSGIGQKGVLNHHGRVSELTGPRRVPSPRFPTATASP